jgi:hypothetical protein
MAPARGADRRLTPSPLPVAPDQRRGRGVQR